MGEGRCYGWVDPVAWSSADVRGLARSAAGRSLRALKARSLCPHPARPPHASTRAGSRFVCMGHCAAMAGRSFRRRRPAARVRSLRALRKLPPEDRLLRAPIARSATACVRILRALRRLRPERVRAAARAVRRRPMRQNGKSRPQARQASCRRRRTVAGIFDPVRDRRAAGFDPNGFAFCVSGCMGHCAAMAGRSFAPRRPATLASACASQAAARGKAALSTDRMQCVQMAAPSGGELPLV